MNKDQCQCQAIARSNMSTHCPVRTKEVSPYPPSNIFDLTGIFADNLILSEINTLQ